MLFRQPLILNKVVTAMRTKNKQQQNTETVINLWCFHMFNRIKSHETEQAFPYSVVSLFRIGQLRWLVYRYCLFSATWKKQEATENMEGQHMLGDARKGFACFSRETIQLHLTFHVIHCGVSKLGTVLLHQLINSLHLFCFNP